MSSGIPQLDELRAQNAALTARLADCVALRDREAKQVEELTKDLEIARNWNKVLIKTDEQVMRENDQEVAREKAEFEMGSQRDALRLALKDTRKFLFDVSFNPLLDWDTKIKIDAFLAGIK